MDHEESVDKLMTAESSVNQDQQSPNDFHEIMKRSQYDVLTMTKEELDKLLSTGVLIDNGEKVFIFSLLFFFPSRFLFVFYIFIGTHCVRHSRIWYFIMNSSFR